MHATEFYDIIDQELLDIIAKYKAIDKRLQAHKKVIQLKPYAFLIWFLEFYGKALQYNQYITEGTNDYSCDIIFPTKDSQGKKIFYIVQSKWTQKKRTETQIKRTDIKIALDDFRLVLSGNKPSSQNDKFNKQYTDLQKHLAENGKVKFLILTLAAHNPKAESHLQTFEEEHHPIEVIDIHKLKRDYIEVHYKKIQPANPLEYSYDPEEEEIKLPIEQLTRKGNYTKISKPFEGYILLVRPKTIYQLFEKYGFKLFFKNVRNPLLQSDYNKELVRTMTENPSSFWYYNNGLTAISYILPERINPVAQSITITGLQIINGAQTVYAVYQAYKQASVSRKRIMNKEGLLTFRLLKSGGKDFDLKVTRYTNTQNPMEDRDFWANDPTQVRLQEESFQTNYWYEKRRGEFREVPENVNIISNRDYALAYLATYLQQPHLAVKTILANINNGIDLIFKSHKEHPDGLYEVVFNEKTDFNHMLKSNDISQYTHLSIELAIDLPSIASELVIIYCSALTFFVLNKYSTLREKKLNSITLIIRIYFLQYLESKYHRNTNAMEFLLKPSFYENLVEYFEQQPFDVEKIETLSLEELMKEYNKEVK